MTRLRHRPPHRSVTIFLFWWVVVVFGTSLIRAQEEVLTTEQEEEEGFVAVPVAVVPGRDGEDSVSAATNMDATSSGTAAAASDKEKRLWGSKTGTSEAPPLGALSIDPAEPHKDIPFVFKSSNNHNNNHQIHHEPPQGFQISSRVFTDPKDKLAHFDNDSAMVFPYWECGVSGSTTVPIPLQHATVRYLLGGSQPTMYSGAEFGPYPQLLVALSPLEISLDSGQTQLFASGDVILLEDTISVGHKLKGIDNKDMTVMILTLTEPYHQVGKAKTSLTSILNKDGGPQRWKISPCPNGLEFSRVEERGVGLGHQLGRVLRTMQQPRSVRKYLLSVVGLSASSLMADFVGRVAPLWLAVLFGGGCFVAGGTLAFVRVGDKALNELEMWKEQRQLRLQGPDNDDDEDRQDENQHHHHHLNNNLHDPSAERPEGGPHIPLPP
jgi:hypothetical protein